MGFNNNKEIGAIVLEHDNSIEAKFRLEELSWVLDRASVMDSDGFSLNDMKEVIRMEYEIYGV